MPKFTKFLKGILSNRRQKGDFETVALTENCSALLTTNIPPKLQDPGSFSIPCKIDSELIQKAFCDLGASISLLPYSLCKKLGLQNIKLTTMALQLADHSCRYPMEIVEDMLVEVDGCIVPTDFIVLDMEEDPKIPIILGKPFLATAGALIDGNSSKTNIHRAEEYSFQERSSPASNKKYICPARAKLKDVYRLHELAVSISWAWRHRRSPNDERRVTMSLKDSAV
ncbi:uncharacterized protein LOC122043781 [Zingiber officinale]|uniref:uncharacterized protein LOC122043781 n=1 Tax=Zingiber officinale TaxID=94328 RepID=UPI001C4A9FEC|nr:uncharacterized protein LOC122043781 [Zingiber officinale]